MSKWFIFDVPFTPKFTEDSRNILKVNSKKEIFFDVFECTFNDKNIIVEKIGEEDGLPIVQFQTIHDSTKLSCEAILVVGDGCDLFLNENNLQFVKNIKKPIVKNIIQEKVEKVIPVNTIYESKVKDLSEKIIAESEEKAQKLYDSKLQEYKSRKQEITQQAEQYLNDKSESIKQELNEQFINFLSDNDDNVKKIIKRNIDDISSNVDESIKSIILKVEKLSGSNKQELIKILSENINNINNNIDEKIEDLNNELEVILHNNTSKINKLEEKTNSLLKTNVKNIEKNISSKVKELNERVDDYKVDTLKAIVEKVAENKSEIEDSLKRTVSEINEQVNVSSSDVKKILTAELSNINEKLNIFSEEEDKKYKQLFENLNNLNKGEVKKLLSEKINDKQINSIKLDISKQFQNEMMSIKRLVEMSSGGGSVAKQFANGGTMDGSLNVTHNILSGGRNLADIFNTDTVIDLQDVTDNGNTTTNSISTNNTIYAETGEFTTLNALTANFNRTIVSTTSALSVVNDGTGPALYVKQSGVEPVAEFVDKEGGIVIIDDGGNVGIGTASPDELLHLEATSQSSTREVLMKATVSDAGNDHFGISNGTSTDSNFAPSFYGYKDSNYGNGYIYSMNFRGLVPSSQDTTQTNRFGIIHFETFKSSSATDPNNSLDGGVSNRKVLTVANDSDTLVNIEANGNVGIGTSSPTEKLEVNGDLMLQENGVIKNKNNNTQFRFGANDLFLDNGHLRADYSVGIRGNRGNTKGMDQGSTTSDLGLYCGGIEAISIHSNGDTLVNNDLQVAGHLQASTKSFLVKNPNGGKLQYGVIEGREHAVYYRGKTTDSTITLPEEWEWLVHGDSITVQLTPIGKFQGLYVVSQNNETVEVGGVEGEYNYVIYGTRKDVNKLEVNI